MIEYMTIQYLLKFVIKLVNQEKLFFQDAFAIILIILFLIFSFQMNDRFYVSSVNANLSNKQLLDQQKKLLQNYYNQQDKMYSGTKRYFQVNPQHQQQQIYQPESKDIERKIKEALSSEYKEQMKMKQQTRKKQRQQQRKQQQNSFSKISEIQYMQHNKAADLNALYRKQVLQDLQVRQKMKKKKLQEQLMENEFFKRRYSQQKLGSQKSQSFQQYYDKVNQFYNQVQKNYLKNADLKNRQKQYEKDKIVNKGIERSNSQIVQAMKNEAMQAQKNRENLKNQLVKQIQQNRLRRQIQKKLDKQQPYTSQIFRKVHHPINNPVDFRITHDNKYILNQLTQGNPQHKKSKQLEKGQKVSGLARSGSQVLLY